jgi:hypothetical protein
MKCALSMTDTCVTFLSFKQLQDSEIFCKYNSECWIGVLVIFVIFIYIYVHNLTIIMI